MQNSVKLNYMKLIIFICIVCITGISACNELENQVKVVDPAEHNMKFIPLNPNRNDIIRLVIYDDCTYNKLSGMKINGKTIEIGKQFNSMMKLPCQIQNDTIIIGTLSEGTYIVNYKLIDIASLQAPNTILSLTFSLLVSM